MNDVRFVISEEGLWSWDQGPVLIIQELFLYSRVLLKYEKGQRKLLT